jgi:hypothetical protein
MIFLSYAHLGYKWMRHQKISILLYDNLRLSDYINVREILLEMSYFNRFLKAVLSIY